MFSWTKSKRLQDNLAFFKNHVKGKCAMSERNVYVGVCHLESVCFKNIMCDKPAVIV